MTKAVTTKATDSKKIAWGITGAGHYLPNCVNLMNSFQNVDVFLSKAAKEVLGFYKLTEAIKEKNHPVYNDVSASCNPVNKLYTGKYKVVVIAPVTSNTIAKMVSGIADNLVTNLFTHAGKSQVPTIILPCDIESDIQTIIPDGGELPVYVRQIDRENILRLGTWEGVTLVSNPQELQKVIQTITA